MADAHLINVSCMWEEKKLKSLPSIEQVGMSERGHMCTDEAKGLSGRVVAVA